MRFLQFILTFTIFFGLFIFLPKNVFAGSEACTQGCWIDPFTGQKDGDCSPIGYSVLTECLQTQEKNYCDRINWILYYNRFCKKASFPCTQQQWIDGNCGNPTADCAWQSNQCSVGDRCEDHTPTINNVPFEVSGPNGGGGTGSNGNGVGLAAYCDPTNPGIYDTNGNVVNPNAACSNGPQYKQCCINSSISSCSLGSCPGGYQVICGPSITQSLCDSISPSYYQAGNKCLPNSSCGASACAGPATPPHTSTTCPGQTAPVCANGASPTCPNGYIYGSDSAGNKVCIDRSTGLPNCNVKPSCPSGCPNTGGWTGQQCNGPSSPNLAQACATDTTTCNKCSSAVCTLYDSGSNLYCYYNNTSACYIDSTFCKGFGNCGVCIQGSTKIDCSAPNVCQAP